MRPSAPPWPEGDPRRSVRSENPDQNRRSAVQPRVAIPPPPRVPTFATSEAHREIDSYTDAALPRHTDTLPAPPESEAIVPSDPPEDTDVISREVYEKRVTELLSAGNRQLQEARDERAPHAKTRLQLECVTAQFLAWRAALNRLDPVWRTS